MCVSRSRCSCANLPELLLSNSHMHREASESSLGSVSRPRIFGNQTGAGGDRTANLPANLPANPSFVRCDDVCVSSLLQPLGP